jgi:hypothetical protein
VNRSLRLVGIFLLLAATALVALFYPSVIREPWDLVQGFQVDAEECRALREARETTTFRRPAADAPDALEGQLTLAEVARRYNLELARLCEANGLPAGCGSQELGPGEEIVLPLSRQAVRGRDRAEPPPTPEGGG